MVAIVASLMVAVYVVIPLVLSRALIDWKIPLRKVPTRSDSLARGLIYLLPSLALAYLLYKLAVIPWHAVFGEGYALSEPAWQSLFSGIYSDLWFRNNRGMFFAALKPVVFRQAGFLGLYYLIAIPVVCVAVIWAAKRFGRWHAGTKEGSGKRSLLIFLEGLLLPKVSTWHTLLTPFMLPSPNHQVWAEILMNDSRLYRGKIHSHYTDADGELTGIILESPRRFRRAAFIDARKEGKTAVAEDFWVDISGNNIYLVAHQILNINLHHRVPPQYPKTDLEASLSKVLQLPKGSTIKITFGQDEPVA